MDKKAQKIGPGSGITSNNGTVSEFRKMINLQSKENKSTATTTSEAPNSTDINSVVYNNNRFYCRFCKREFYLQRFLDDHERNHTHPFKCKKCNESWALFSGLNDHLKTGCAPPEPTPPPSRITIVNPAMFDPFYIPENEPYVPPDDFSDDEPPPGPPQPQASPVNTKRRRGRAPGATKKNGFRKKVDPIPISKFKCRTCGKCFANLAYLVKHERIHTRRHQCTQCSDRFAEFYLLRAHIQKFHNEADSPNPAENVPNSNEKPTTINVKVPDNTTEKKQNGNSSSKPKSPSKNDSIVESTPIQSPKPKPPTKLISSSTKYVACTECSKLISASSIRIHMRTHSGFKPYACQLCPYRATQRGPLNKHMRHHNEVSEFKCKYCTATYNDLMNLGRHEKLHEGEPPSAPKENDVNPAPKPDTTYDFTPSPPTVAKSPSKPLNIKKISPNIITIDSTQEQPKPKTSKQSGTPCKYCDKHKTFKSLVRLATHELFHTSKYACAICEAGFMTQAHLTRHFKSKIHQERAGGPIDSISPGKGDDLNSSLDSETMELESGSGGSGYILEEMGVGPGDVLDFDLNDYI